MTQDQIDKLYDKMTPDVREYVFCLIKGYEKLEALVELLYYKIELNDEDQELLDSILNS